jgi:two-component system, OmpR family, phosphate regulon response regulator PhoB
MQGVAEEDTASAVASETLRDESPPIAASLCRSLSEMPGPSDPRRAQRILIVERDSQSMQLLSSKLAQAGFAVTMLDRSEDAFAAIDHHNPHLVMLDWDLPGVISVQLLRHLQALAGDRAPRLIALSAFSAEQHVVSGFELGIDDYVVKPFSVAELVARVRAVLRSARFGEEDPNYLEFCQLRMDASEGRVTVRDGTVSLRGMEFRLLEFLMRHPERAFSREALLRRVWGHDCRADQRAVDVTVQRMRRALSPHRCEGYVQTVRGVGYRLSASELAR